MDRQREAGRANRSDAADLQRLIRYVERWRLARFQRADGSGIDGQMADADALLRKLRAGLQLASQAPQHVTGNNGPVYLY
jgi:hypothetical protein